MLTKLLQIEDQAVESPPVEGDLYKTVTTFGKTFELRYGYYSDSDRKYEPDIIYPNFMEDPAYADDGCPFVTAMQEPCGQFAGKKNKDSSCGDCSYYNKGTELIGVCTCPQNKRK